MAEVILEDAPRKARELFDKGFAAMERDNLDYAVDMFLAALDIEPRLLQARKFLRAAEVKKFKRGKANALTHQLATLQGMGNMLTATALMKSKPERALAIAEKLLRIDPLNPSFINVLAQAAQNADLPEVAIQTLEIACDHYAKDAKLIQRLADLYAETGQTHKARERFERLAALRPNDPKIIKALKDATAVDTMNKGGWDSADSYRDVIKDTKEATTLEQESKAVKSDKDIEALIEEMQTRLRVNPDDINTKRALADLYGKAQRFDEAIVLIEEVQATSGTGDSQIDRALSRFRLGQYDFNIEALRADGKNDDADAILEEKEAFVIRDAEDRVQRYPNDLQFRYEFAILLYEHGKLNDAIQQFQLSQKNPQRRISSLYHLALCFKAKGQHDIAIEQLEKAASELHSMDNMKKDIFYELGLINEATGDKAKATEYFKGIYAVDIGYKDVSSKIEDTYRT